METNRKLNFFSVYRDEEAFKGVYDQAAGGWTTLCVKMRCSVKVFEC